MDDLKKELGIVKQKIRRLEARSKRLTQELQRLKAREKELESKIEPDDIGIVSDSVTESVFITIVTHKIPMFPSEVLGKLELDGHKFNHVKDPYTQIYNICARLVKQGKIKSVIKDGKKAFVR